MSDLTNINELIAYDDEEEDFHPTESVIENKERKPDQDNYVTMYSSSFKEFLLRNELLKALNDNGFEHPSQVQHECTPQALLGTDVICQAKSGMGKTAVFVLAVLHQIDPSVNQTSTIVLCHTRELAFQIYSEFDRFSKYMPLVKKKVFYGGVPITQHREYLKSETPHVVIGTPGRVLQLVEERTLDLSHIKHFILDECDKMLESTDMRSNVQSIFKKTPHQKQVMMFTATLNDETRATCKKFMHNPLEIYINDGSKLTLHGLQQYFVELPDDKKNRKLIDLLDELEYNQVVIFVKSIPRATALNKLLEDSNFPSICIHSGMKQEQRIERYQMFKSFKKRIMVATNLFGRGIDVERVNVVFNYDMAESSDTYLHRVGRAGRFGTKGLAISFISANSAEDKQILEDVQKRFVVTVKPLPEKIDCSTYMTS